MGVRKETGNKPLTAPASSSSFAWDLGVLKVGDAVENAMAQKADRIINVRKGPAPLPLGGAVDDSLRPGDPTREEPIATLAVSWMMAVKAGCIQPRHVNYWICNQWSRGLYVVSLILCIGVTIATLVQHQWFNLDLMDWFAWTSWGVVAVSEVLFLMLRLMGRWRYLEAGAVPQKLGWRELVEAFARLGPFGEGWQAVTVIFINAVGSATVLFGFGVMHMQIMLDETDDVNATVDYPYRRAWTLWWTLAYAVTVAGFVWAAFIDPSRLADLDAVTGWAVEFSAWRVLLLALAMPIIGVAFAVYGNVCCEGDWIL